MGPDPKDRPLEGTDIASGRSLREQITGILKEAEAGAVVTELCRKHGTPSATYYACKAKFGGLEVSDAKGCGRSRRRTHG